MGIVESQFLAGITQKPVFQRFPGVTTVMLRRDEGRSDPIRLGASFDATLAQELLALLAGESHRLPAFDAVRVSATYLDWALVTDYRKHRNACDASFNASRNAAGVFHQGTDSANAQLLGLTAVKVVAEGLLLMCSRWRDLPVRSPSLPVPGRHILRNPRVRRGSLHPCRGQEI